jgi:adenylate kinase
MKLILIGIQGSGKSTQGDLLSKQLNIPFLSAGNILRVLAQEETAFGRYIKETINAGLLLPDDKILEIITGYLLRPEFKKGYILDGFPRTVGQAKKFTDKIDKVIHIKIDDKEALHRIALRNDSSRQDEAPITIKKRIDSFKEYTVPVLNYYRKKNLLIEIEGIKTIIEVNQEILKSLGIKS